MTVVCVTNYMDDIPSCVIRGEHQIVCDGYAYRWSIDESKEIWTGRECRGCLPKEARHGHLCWECWQIVIDARAGYQKLTARLSGIDRAIVRDNAGVRTSSLGSIPIPAVQVMLLELQQYRQHLMDEKTIDGAKWAIRFGRAFAAALKSHPTEETAHRIRKVRCTKCRQLTLIWNPVQVERGDVEVKCSNQKCGAMIDQASYEKIAIIEDPKLADKVMIDAGQPVDARGDFAEKFEPTKRPEHADLDPLSTMMLAELRAMAEQLQIPHWKRLTKSQLIAGIHDVESEAIAL